MEIDSTKARILEAAGQVFGEKGFEAGTVREICQLASANLAAVNYHFGDKQRLYVEAVKHAHCARADEFPLPDWAPGAPADQRLREFIGVTLQRMLAETQAPWHAQLMLREIAQPNVACEALVREYIRPHFAVLRSILRELVPADVTDEKLTLTGFSVIGQCLFYRLAQPVVRLLEPQQFGRLDVTLLADHITGVMLAALGVRPAIVVQECLR